MALYLITHYFCHSFSHGPDFLIFPPLASGCREEQLHRRWRQPEDPSDTLVRSAPEDANTQPSSARSRQLHSSHTGYNINSPLTLFSSLFTWCWRIVFCCCFFYIKKNQKQNICSSGSHVPDSTLLGSPRRLNVLSIDCTSLMHRTSRKKYQKYVIIWDERLRFLFFFF